MTDSPNHAAYFVPGLHRGLRILEILGAADTPKSVSEVAKALDVGRSSAFRYIYTLKQEAYIKEGEQKNTYTLGPRVMNLGFAYLNQQPIAEIARPYLSGLRDKTGISAHLSVLEGHDVLYLGSHQARTGFISNMVTGTRRKAYASPIGWCLLDRLSDDEIKIMCESGSMEEVTEHTPTNYKALLQRINNARKHGHVYSKGFNQIGGSSVAVPIKDHTGTTVACVNISGPDIGFEAKSIETFFIPTVKETAKLISYALGYIQK